jgi:uncharacterized 2Fe-2S/4Fe-4S cluster protein (DUF4445 family)
MTEKRRKTWHINFQPSGKGLDVEDQSSLLAAVRRVDIALSATCGGQGKCGQCRVNIKKGSAPPFTETEARLLSRKSLEEGQRLACQIPVMGDMDIDIPQDALATRTRLQLHGTGQAVALHPHVSSCLIPVILPSREDSRSDFKRIADALQLAKGPAEYTAGPEVVRQLPAALRQGRQHLTAYLRANELIGLSPPDHAPLGVAIDLGTTNIAAALVDLQTGQELDAQGKQNPQIRFGGDLISRLTHANASAGNAAMLAMNVREALDELLGQLVAAAGASRSQITDLCIVGNTAMIHLLLEFPVAQLAGAPYVAATHTALDIRAATLGLNTAPGAMVHIPGNIGGFVGGDHVSMILASRLDRTDHIALGIDIGTNSEIALYSPVNGALTSCSCASGPAFEGGHTHCGMTAEKGAIEKVHIHDDHVALTTIDNAPPRGICGSGIIDILAELRRNAIVNRNGLLDKKHPLVRQGASGPEVVLVRAARNGRAQDIVLTQKDISEIQLAKGAIRAGMETLLAVTQTSTSAVAEVMVAGAFGSYLNLDSVRAIGMFPDFANARLHQIGNAALEGAKMILLSKEERAQAAKILEASRHLETSTNKDFARRFAKAIQFPD